MAIQAQLYNEGIGFSEIHGCGNASFNEFCFNAMPKNQISYNQYHQNLQHQQQQQQVRLQEIQSFNQKNVGVLSAQAVFNHVEKKQRLEIDQYINFQNERLRLILQEQRKQHVRNLVRRVEPRLQAILQSKDDEIERARKKTMELENLVRKLEAENQSWQRLARESEVTVLSLSDALDQARERADSCHVSADADDSESCCGETAGEFAGDQVFCRNCGSNKASVLFLPCRHFCSCKHCEVFLDTCPVCTEPKKASIEALTF